MALACVMVLARVMSPLRDSHSLLARVECYSGAPVMVLACVMVLARAMVSARVMSTLRNSHSLLARVES